jgi:hypothetical protein
MLTHRMSPINRIGTDSPVKLSHNGAKILEHLEPGTVPALELSGFCALQRSGHGDRGRRRGWCGHQAHADLNAAENIRQGRCKEAERDAVENRRRIRFA